MVKVGDKVFVAALYGQKDNIAVITGPAGQTGSTGTGGIVEGNYNEWTYKWTWEPTEGFNTYYKQAFYMDEINGIFYLWWMDDQGSPNWATHRFGIYNIVDHSIIFESPLDSHYTPYEPSVGGAGDRTISLGCHSLYQGIPRSHQTYILVNRLGQNIIEMWRAGTKIWTHDITDDTGEAFAGPYATDLSLTGKYILFYEGQIGKLMLYEGFDAGTSTTVTETVITDTAKSWVIDELIGHIVYITSGGADGQEGTITSNTATAITCSAATFVTWGMSVGDTYKIS